MFFTSHKVCIDKTIMLMSFFCSVWWVKTWLRYVMKIESSCLLLAKNGSINSWFESNLSSKTSTPLLHLLFPLASSSVINSRLNYAGDLVTTIKSRIKTCSRIFVERYVLPGIGGSSIKVLWLAFSAFSRL